MQRITLLLLLCLPLACAAQLPFVLEGQASPALEGRTLYISNRFTEYSKTEVAINDSCVVRQGKFRFTGLLNNPATMVSLMLQPGNMGFKQFFLERKPMAIIIHPTQKRNLLDSCTISGSPVNEQARELETAKKDYLKKFIDLSIREQTLYEKAGDSLKNALRNESRLLAKEETDITKRFILQHPDYYLSLYWFCYLVTDRIIAQPDSALRLFNTLSEPLRNLPEAYNVLQRIYNKLALTTNRQLPEFSIPDPAGQLIHSADYRGKYLLIDLWASWCGPCIEQIPAVKDLHRRYSKNNLALLSISLDDDRKRWTDALQRHAMPWTQVSELKGWQGDFARKLDIRYIPQYYLADPDGKFVLMGADIDAVKQYLTSTFPGN